MRIEKKTHFYAAHRNQELKDKCCNLHGHSYFVVFTFEFKREGSITKLFGDIEVIIDPIVKGEFDHALLIDINDPLYLTLKTHHPEFKMVEFNEPTSVENLCQMLFGKVSTALKEGDLIELTVQETTTSVIRYTAENYHSDLTAKGQLHS